MRRFLLTVVILTIGLTVISACDSENNWFEEEIITTDTTFISDTTYQQDTTIIKKDTVINNDTIIKIDTIINTDTIIKTDTIVKKDTSIIYPIDISLYMEQYGNINSRQGADCYNGYLFQFRDGHDRVFVYNLDKKEFYAEIRVNAEYANHCNNASFSRIYFEESDEFPLIYVSGGKVNTYNEIHVFRIIRDNNSSFNISKIQVITLPTPSLQNLLYMTNAVIDNENNFIYTYGYYNGTQIAKFSIPDPHIPKVELKDSDILDHFSLEPSPPNFQGGTIKDGLLYIMYGVPHLGNTIYLRIIDLKRKKDHFTFNLSEMGYGQIEFENISCYQDGFVSATDGYISKGIYYLKFNSKEE